MRNGRLVSTRREQARLTSVKESATRDYPTSPQLTPHLPHLPSEQTRSNAAQEKHLLLAGSHLESRHVRPTFRLDGYTTANMGGCTRTSKRAVGASGAHRDICLDDCTYRSANKTILFPSSSERKEWQARIADENVTESSAAGAL